MIGYKITIPGSKSSVICYDAEGVFNRICKITNDEYTAIEVSSWCEIAGIGEEYENDKFSVEIVED